MRKRKLRAAKWLRAVFRVTALITVGAVAARIIILAIETAASRVGLLGGEVFIPLYIIVGPWFGWRLRGWRDELKEEACINTSVRTVARTSMPGKPATASRKETAL